MRWLVVAVMALSAPLVASSPLTLRVTPHRTFAPAILTATIHVRPDAHNREMEVGLVGSEGYLADSARQLDGSHEPPFTILEWRDVPAGHYEVIVDVTQDNGRHLIAKDTLDVLGDNN